MTPNVPKLLRLRETQPPYGLILPPPYQKLYVVTSVIVLVFVHFLIAKLSFKISTPKRTLQKRMLQKMFKIFKRTGDFGMTFFAEKLGGGQNAS